MNQAPMKNEQTFVEHLFVDVFYFILLALGYGVMNRLFNYTFTGDFAFHKIFTFLLALGAVSGLVGCLIAGLKQSHFMQFIFIGTYLFLLAGKAVTKMYGKDTSLAIFGSGADGLETWFKFWGQFGLKAVDFIADLSSSFLHILYVVLDFLII